MEHIYLILLVQRSCLRAALPPRRRPEDIVPNVVLRKLFPFPTVATLLQRRQLRWCGHLVRMDDTRILAIFCSAGSSVPGRRVPGRGSPSLLGVFGSKGVYKDLTDKYLFTRSPARRTFFNSSRAPWYVLAQDRDKWCCFVKSVVAP